MEMTDIVDLLGESDLRRTLLQCGTGDARAFSHYELFRSFCQMQTDLTGHRLQRRCKEILTSLLGSADPLNADACDALWHEVADRLLLEPDVCGTIDGKSTDRKTSLDAALLNAVRICPREWLYSANRLILTRTESWEAWRAQIEHRLAEEADHCDAILYRLPRRYVDRAPNPYAIGQIQKQKTRGVRDRDLLHAQILRHLFLFCREKKKSLILVAPCASASLVSLLERLKREVGLPMLACAVAFPTDPRILDFTVENQSLTLAVDASFADAHESLVHTLLQIADGYPLGRVSVIR